MPDSPETLKQENETLRARIKEIEAINTKIAAIEAHVSVTDDLKVLNGRITKLEQDGLLQRWIIPWGTAIATMIFCVALTWLRLPQMAEDAVDKELTQRAQSKVKDAASSLLPQLVEQALRDQVEANVVQTVTAEATTRLANVKTSEALVTKAKESSDKLLAQLQTHEDEAHKLLERLRNGQLQLTTLTVKGQQGAIELSVKDSGPCVSLYLGEPQPEAERVRLFVDAGTSVETGHCGVLRFFERPTQGSMQPTVSLDLAGGNPGYLKMWTNAGSVARLAVQMTGDGRVLVNDKRLGAE